jgi:DNA-binding transcriptional regulator LsrR (DeoR family)
MKKRQPNQHKILLNDLDLTDGAERLLSLIRKYQYTYNVTNKQYSYLMGISLRNTVKYINELIKKGRIQTDPPNRRKGRGKANKYLIIETSCESRST